ncbi:MAG: Dihydroflavonol-4-reductase [Anaerolineae bacterium]|jgi:dihydroflavonol-4-reductase|nr:MAG: Dihydroflavonol-4-reductase [Anaerolineae bacterium]
MSILVTGATGHIGNVLVRKLVEQGEKVRAFYWYRENPLSLSGVDAELFPGDILDRNSLQRAMEGVDTIYHLAGVISIMPGPNPLIWRVNVEGTRNILELAKKKCVKRLVYTSSIHALRRIPTGRIIDESVGFDPDNPYGEYDRCKAIASLDVKRAAQEGLDAVIICPTGVIGPYDFYHSEMGEFLQSVAQGQLIFYIEGAYDFVDVRDVVAGLISARAAGRRDEIYILGGHKVNIKELIKTVSRITRKPTLNIKLPLFLAKVIARISPYYARIMNFRPRLTPYSIEVLRSNSDISHQKATRELGYKPRPIFETISDTVKWFLEEQPRSVLG